VTGEEARTLVGFLKSAFPGMTAEQAELYEANLLHEDARLASRAILDGIKEWKFVPKYAEIVERIKMFRRAATVKEPPPDPGKAVPPPFWVRRWLVARYVAQPPDLRRFREEEGFCPEGFVPEEGWMPEDAWVEEAEILTLTQIANVMSGLGVGGRP